MGEIETGERQRWERCRKGRDGEIGKIDMGKTETIESRDMGETETVEMEEIERWERQRNGEERKRDGRYGEMGETDLGKTEIWERQRDGGLPARLGRGAPSHLFQPPGPSRGWGGGASPWSGITSRP